MLMEQEPVVGGLIHTEHGENSQVKEVTSDEDNCNALIIDKDRESENKDNVIDIEDAHLRMCQEISKLHVE